MCMCNSCQLVVCLSAGASWSEFIAIEPYSDTSTHGSRYVYPLQAINELLKDYWGVVRTMNEPPRAPRAGTIHKG